ncbi:MAG: hypothetical protein K9M99_01335 [Candidatus Cloacimonetes bacterium]|nr:hypothetical protein [Candidatus Cloacimonadota bacterium]
MKDKKVISQTDQRLSDFLSTYQEEELTAEFQSRVFNNAINSSQSPGILRIAPMWKRLSLAASVAAFALGVIMSNQVFSSSTESSSWSFGDTGLYSYLVEGE